MSLILVVESEGRHAERVRDGLGSDGWQVEVVASCEAAVAAVADRAPQLVLINAELPGAPEMLRNLSRAHGGPGSIALLPEVVGRELGPLEADESLIKPFSEKDLRQLARRVVASARPPRKSETEPDQKRLTSQELFGDLLAEVENEVAGAASAAAPPPTQVTPPTTPTPPPAARPAAPSSPGAGVGARSLEMEQRLERTLSGMTKDAQAAAPAAKKASTRIDDMLSATLSGLDMPKRSAKPAAPVPPVATPAASAPAPRPAVPAGVAAPAPVAPVSPVVPVTPAAPIAPIAPVAPVAAAAAPTGKASDSTTAARKQSREIDLSQLDQLAKPRARESGPAARPAAPKETFATQKIQVQPSFLQPPSSAFGQYTLLERIAVGGMAEVWKARMKGVEGFQKTVAIKKILPHLTDSSDFVTMFIDEAKLAAQLNHNNIIHIYDLGKIGDDYFIAMEFVDGKDLRSILNSARAESRPLPLGLALMVGSRLASALDHAHRQKDFEGRALGLVHRDVSPQNVLISYEGDIKLCDFGIVKAVTKTSKTQMGALKGKLQYMSPEQAWGRPVDARSDIFSLGSLLFEMLTGRRLFSGESEISVLDAVREGRIQAPRDLDPRLPLEVNALVLKALARDPEDRFKSAGEMQREIDGILASLKPAPSQADLGAYLHQLFAAEALAGAAPTPTASAASTPARGAASAPSAAVPARPVEVAVVAPTGVSKIEDADAGRSGKMLWIAIGGVAAAGLLAYVLLGRGAPSAPPATPAPAGTEASAAPEAGAATGALDANRPATEATGATPAAAAPDAGQNVDQMVSDEVKRREEELKKKYEEELARRKTELDKLNTKPQAAAATTAAAPPPAQEAPPAPVPAPAAVVETPPAAVPEPVVETPPAAVPQAPETPQVKEGDLVRPGAGVKPPVLVSLTKPEYPAMARRMKVEGTVIVSLLVDETGRVAETRLESGVSQKVGINEAALAAVRSAVFSPATKAGVRVKMWYQLKIPFKL